MIEIDEREPLFYDCNMFLSLEPDAVPHYFTLLIGKFNMFNPTTRRKTCIKCNHHQTFKFESKWYCINNYLPVYDEESGEITSVNKVEDDRRHELADENFFDSIRRITKKIIDMVEEPTGYRMDLFDLESSLFRQPEDAFFETKGGEVTKNQLRKELYQMKKICISELTLLRKDIRFTSQLHVPSIRLNPY